MVETNTAPLTNFSVVGLRENWYQAAPDDPKQPGGSCWHCGTGIAIEVVIQSTETGETHTIGTTCAERVGLSGKELKALMAERFAEQRYLASKAGREAAAKAADEREKRETATHGSHGTESRYLSGCYCEACRSAAPHGDITRFDGGCYCLRCIDAALESGRGYKVQPDRHVIVRIESGEIVQAKAVDTRFGYRWCVRDGICWLPVSPARRSTHAKHGYVQAEAPFLVQSCGTGRDRYLRPVCRLGEPVVDKWGERIVR